MAMFVVVGAGPVGQETARLLAVGGHAVRLVSRGGTTLAHAGIDGVALDARDAQGLANLSAGAEAIFMCAMAAYNKWPTDFPPIMAGVVEAAEAVRAKLIVLGNIYGYGQSAASPLTANAPLAPTTVKGRVRVAMWERALASTVPALEVRASDYLGDGAASLFTLMTLPSLLTGKPALVLGDLDAPHAWSFTKDVARTLVAAAHYTGNWGRAFLVPSHHLPVRELAARYAASAGVAASTLRPLSDDDLAELASKDEIMREVVEMSYLFRRPCVLDASETEQLLEVSSSSLDVIVKDTLQKLI